MSDRMGCSNQEPRVGKPNRSSVDSLGAARLVSRLSSETSSSATSVADSLLIGEERERSNT